MKRGIAQFAAAVSAGVMGIAGPASASWNASQLNQLVNGFETGVAPKYAVTSYPFEFFSLASCYQPGVQCPFLNPDGPYGQPQINDSLQYATQMGSTEALVMIMETPPPMLYYGVTPYIYTRYYSQLPGAPTGTSGTRELLESLDDTLDMVDLKTTGSSTPGVNSFSQLTAIIMTADKTTYTELAQVFTTLHFGAVNQLDLPYKGVPLKMGTTGPQYDTYTVEMRLAYPTDATAMQNYINAPPIAFLRLTPLATRSISALPAPTYKVPGDGASEEPALQTARDALVSQLLTHYGSQYTAAEQTLKITQTQNYVCVTKAINCNGDNSDAIYSHDDDNWVPKTLQDKLLIVGVNHVDTGKATYISHSILNETHQAGVEAVNQEWLAGSALKMAGITSTSDPRYATYSQLYAFTAAYDCTGEPVCLVIPQPTSTNPVGITFGDTIGESFRDYVEPDTKTRPAVSELIMHRVFTLTKK